LSAEASRSNALVLVIVLAITFCMQFILSDYYALALTRMMVLAIFAVGYNVLFGYVGLLSLGHALFFAAGVYGAGMPAYHLGWSVPLAFAAGIAAALVVAATLGAVILRTNRMSFMIVTLMFAQIGYLLTLYFPAATGGPDGLSMPGSARRFGLLGATVDLTNPAVRYNIAFGLLALSLIICFVYVKGARGRLLAALRENESRTEMLGVNIFAQKLAGFALSGAICGASGAAYALLFGYMGSTFATTQYSIEVLLFTLLGGAGTLLGPMIGTIAMVFMIDRISEVTSAYFLVIGILLILLVLWFPKGLLGTVRQRWLPWMM
jgi:branched-chain amino acid transport system permease protein